MENKQQPILLSFTTAEKVYQAIIESLPHIVWVGDSDGQVTFMNKAWHDLTGYSMEESLGEGWAAAIHPKDAPELLKKWGNAYTHGEPYQGECRFVNKDGTVIYCTFIGLPVRDENGEITNWVGMDLNITKEKILEKELKDKISELEKMNQMMVDREMKMIELKKEIQKLKNDK